MTLAAIIAIVLGTLAYGFLMWLAGTWAEESHGRPDHLVGACVLTLVTVGAELHFLGVF